MHGTRRHLSAHWAPPTSLPPPTTPLPGLGSHQALCLVMTRGGSLEPRKTFPAVLPLPQPRPGDKLGASHCVAGARAGLADSDSSQGRCPILSLFPLWLKTTNVVTR